MREKNNINRQLSCLTDNQKSSLFDILKKLQSGAHLSGEDVGLLGFDSQSVTQTFCCDFFHISRQTIINWVDCGCPRNPDKTYNLFEVHSWLLLRERRLAESANKKDSRGILREQKLEKEIELLNAKIAKEQSEKMYTKDHVASFASWASSFKKFWEQAWRRNRHYFVNRSQEEVDVLMQEYGRQLMDVWSMGKK